MYGSFNVKQPDDESVPVFEYQYACQGLLCLTQEDQLQVVRQTRQTLQTIVVLNPGVHDVA